MNGIDIIMSVIDEYQSNVLPLPKAIDKIIQLYFDRVITADECNRAISELGDV